MSPHPGAPWTATRGRAVARSARGSTATSEGRGGRARRTGTLLLGFLLGTLLTGVLAVALLWSGVIDSSTVGAPADAEASPPTSPAPTTTPAASGDVPAACVKAAEFNQAFTEALDEIALGVRDQDARQLQEALDAVQDAQPGSEAAAEECLELAGQPSAGSSDPSPEPTSAEDEPDEEETSDPSSTPSPSEPSPTETP